MEKLIAEYNPDHAFKAEEAPTEWRAGPQSLSYNHFSAMLTELDDSAKRQAAEQFAEENSG